MAQSDHVDRLRFAWSLIRHRAEQLLPSQGRSDHSDGTIVQDDVFLPRASGAEGKIDLESLRSDELSDGRDLRVSEDGRRVRLHAAAVTVQSGCTRAARVEATKRSLKIGVARILF